MNDESKIETILSFFEESFGSSISDKLLNAVSKMKQAHIDVINKLNHPDINNIINNENKLEVLEQLCPNFRTWNFFAQMINFIEPLLLKPKNKKQETESPMHSLIYSHVISTKGVVIETIEKLHQLFSLEYQKNQTLGNFKGFVENTTCFKGFLEAGKEHNQKCTFLLSNVKKDIMNLQITNNHSNNQGPQIIPNINSLLDDPPSPSLDDNKNSFFGDTSTKDSISIQENSTLHSLNNCIYQNFMKCIGTNKILKWEEFQLIFQKNVNFELKNKPKNSKLDLKKLLEISTDTLLTNYQLNINHFASLFTNNTIVRNWLRYFDL